MIVAGVVWAVVGLSVLPLLVVSLEILGALLAGMRGTSASSDSPASPASPDAPDRERRGVFPRTVVLIPAHNEAAVIEATLVSLVADLPPHASLLCIAHNCSDETAAIARRFGAAVVEVGDDGRGGKPAALLAGLSWLDADPPTVVVIVDADCVVAPGSLAALAFSANTLQRPVMGTYLFAPADGTSGKATLSSLAILLKNHIRPLGLRTLGLPCLLNGSGIACPFHVLRQAPQGQGSIAEDFQLAIDLLRLGYPTSYVPQARIFGKLPARVDNAMRQRRRWEHGHLSLVFHTAPRLLIEGLRHCDPKRIALALEVGVPPLGFLGLLCAAVLAAAGAYAVVAGDCQPLLAALVADGILIVAVLAAWLKFAGRSATRVALAALPAYVAWKLPLYADYFVRRESVWKKTDRD